MIKHTVTIQIEDVANGEIRIRASCDPVPNDQTIVTSALACAADLLGYLKTKSEPPSEEAQILADPAAVAAVQKSQADEGEFADVASRTDEALVAEQKEEQA